MHRHRTFIPRLLLLSLLATTAQLAAQDRTLPTDLKALRAARGAPVVVTGHGVVTCVQDSQFYVEDQTDAFAVFKDRARDAVAPGDVIELTCERNGAGATFALKALDIVKQGRRSLPEPEMTTLEKVVPGGSKFRRVKIKGSVHDVAAGNSRILLLVDSGIKSVIVTIPLGGATPTPRPDDLLDAVVDVTGVILTGTRFEQTDRFWANMAVNSMDDVRVIKPGVGDPFSRPLRTLAELTAQPLSETAEREHVIGTVTYASESGWFYIQDSAGLTARGRKPDFLSVPESQHRSVSADTHLVPGDVIELVGQVAPNRKAATAMPWLIQCEWRVLRHESPPKFVPMDVDQVYSGNSDGKPVSITGKVESISISEDPNGYINHYLNLAGFSALVQLREKIEVPVKVGQYVRVNGVVKANFSDDGRISGVRVNAQSFKDIQRLRFAIDRSLFFNWVLGIAAVVLIGGLWIVALRKQVRAQTAKLREGNEKFARFYQVVEASVELVAMSTLDMVPLYINPAGRRMLGISLDEEATRIDFTSIYTAESMEIFESRGFAHAFEHGYWQGEITMRHRDGHVIPVAFTGLVLRDANGKPNCMSCVAHDISQQQALEKQLRESLEQERELNQLKSSFVNTISHEFRTPLGIILFASSLLQRLNSLSDAERGEQFQAIDDAVNRMNELVEQSLSLGRAETTGPKLESIDAVALTRQLIDEVLSSTSHRSPITLNADGNLPPALTDPAMLRSIIGNLISNAVKYSPPGSSVIVSLRRQGASAFITVRDHGLGLQEEDLPKLFTMFYRGSNTTGIHGSGLGLAIVKRCAESLGGTVRARNAGGGGAEFIVEIPLFKSSQS